MTECNFSCLEYLDELTLGKHGQPFTGIAIAQYPSGARKIEAVYVDGIPNGLVREWYESGQLRLESTRIGEVDNGLVREWHSNGRLKREASCELGVCLRSTTWDENGNQDGSFVLKTTDPAYKLLELNRSTI